MVEGYKPQDFSFFHRGGKLVQQALIDVYNQFHNNAQLLIPMHDAALYMVDSSIDTNSIINTFKNAFTKWIPNCKPIVKEKNFFEE